MIPPPSKIDGAQVLMYADVSTRTKTDAVRHFADGRFQESFERVAICSYGTGSPVYLFHCDQDWEAENDDAFESLPEALESAICQYAGLNADDFIRI